MNNKIDVIILVGFMGTGKSTIGKLLAQKVGFSFTDTDSRLELEQNTTVPELFERLGEARFRELETDALLRVLTERGQVIATGGGVVLAEVNRKAMLDAGFVVALKADKQTIIDRVSEDKGRPLLQGNVEERVSALLEARKTAYDFADLIVDTTGLSTDEVVNILSSHIFPLKHAAGHIFQSGKSD